MRKCSKFSIEKLYGALKIKIVNCYYIFFYRGNLNISAGVGNV